MTNSIKTALYGFLAITAVAAIVADYVYKRHTAKAAATSAYTRTIIRPLTFVSELRTVDETNSKIFRTVSTTAAYPDGRQLLMDEQFLNPGDREPSIVNPTLAR